MPKTIDAEALVSEVRIAMNEFSQLSAQSLKDAVAETSKGAAKVIRENAPTDKRMRRSGKYRRSIRRETVYEDAKSRRDKIWAGPQEYPLSHLIENGHNLRAHRGTKKGKIIGRAKRIPHFSKGQDYVDQNLEKNIKKKMEK